MTPAEKKPQLPLLQAQLQLIVLEGKEIAK